VFRLADESSPVGVGDGGGVPVVEVPLDGAGAEVIDSETEVVSVEETTVEMVVSVVLTVTEVSTVLADEVGEPVAVGMLKVTPACAQRALAATMVSWS